VINPELEAWVWADSPHVPIALGWNGDMSGLRQRLERKGYWPAGHIKPPDPKAAFEAAARWGGVPPSSGVIRSLSRTVSFRGCRDRGFARLVQALQAWFARNA
jgi:hypothetical protein